MSDGSTTTTSTTRQEDGSCGGGATPERLITSPDGSEANALLRFLLARMSHREQRELSYHWRCIAAGKPEWRLRIAQMIERGRP